MRFQGCRELYVYEQAYSFPRLRVSSVVKIQIVVLWVVTMCSLMAGFWYKRATNRQDGGSIFFPNVGTLIPDYMSS